MKYIDKHIATAVGIIKSYDGAMPLSDYLKQFFAANKKYGGKDRKFIAHFCFLYYRLANAATFLSIEETIKIAIFLTDESSQIITSLFPANWQEYTSATLQQKLAFIKTIYEDFNAIKCFPLVNELSDTIDANEFSISHLVQPDLFLRIRPKQKDKVLRKLGAADISFTLRTNDCLVLPNTLKIDEVLQVDREVVIQDYSSQRIAEFLTLVDKSQISNQKAAISVWDCCAASGGKSILAYDTLHNIKLTVSDIRASIIQNLKARLARAGVPIYHTLIADIADVTFQIPNAKFQLIICDAPCSGSGTWGRTPEQLAYFTKKDIEKYTRLQQAISKNVIKSLAANGYFLYITCSVFKQENEDVVAYIQNEYPALQLIKQELLVGYTTKADSMFAALFQLKS